MTGHLHASDCITIALGQFKPVIGRGLTQILRDDPRSRVIAMNLDPVALEEFAARQAPHVAILDESSATDHGGLMRRLRVAQPRIGIVVIANRPARAYGARLLASGVSACLSIYASAPEIHAAVRSAAEGKQMFADLPVSPIRPSGLDSLTRREREVLQLLSLGQSNVEIARQLHVEVETARTHVKHIFAKLGIGTRRELIGISVPSRSNGPSLET